MSTDEHQPGELFTCVCIPQGHQDAQPAPQEEADLLGIQHLPDGCESLKAEGGKGVTSSVSRALTGQLVVTRNQRDTEMTLPRSLDQGTPGGPAQHWPQNL